MRVTRFIEQSTNKTTDLSRRQTNVYTRLYPYFTSNDD